MPGKVDQLIHDLGSVPGSRATTIDMHIVAGTLGELDKRPWPKNYDRVELIPLSPADASAASHEAQRIYESIAVKNSNFLSGPLLREKNHLKMLYVKEQAGILQ